jgi:putative transposase
LIKGGSSYEIGRALQTHFPVWQPGFTQHLIGSRADYESHVRYIDANPIRKGLVERPEEYPFCSAHGKYQLDPWPPASGAKAPVG